LALAQILPRRGTSAQWIASNPVLASGEIGFDSTVKRMKIGDGNTVWSGLPWATADNATIQRLQDLAQDIEGGVEPTDAIVASAINNPQSATKQALDATIGAVVVEDVPPLLLPLQRRGNRAIGLGDSIMIGSDGAFSGFAGSWFSRLSESSGQRIRRFRNAGIAGQSSTSILARIQSDVIAYDPDICVLEMVTPNDIGQGISLATTKANIVSAIEQLQAAGIRPIVCTGPPNDSPATRDRLNETSAWLVEYANSRGIAVFDLYSPLVDPADGTFLSAYTSDGVHPNVAGQEAVAAFLVERLPRDLNEVPFLSSANLDGNLLANGLFVGDSNADGYADAWTNQGCAAGGLTARADGLGNWQSLTGDATSDYFAATFPCAIGDTLIVAGEWINVDGTNLGVQVNFTGGTPYSQPRPLTGRSDVHAKARTFYMEVVVPAGTSAAAIRLIPGVGTVKFSRLTVRKKV